MTSERDQTLTAPFELALSRDIWESKYRFTDGGEADIAGTWRRVAHSLAAVEGDAAAQWEARFTALMQGFRFLPGGRILAGAGTGQAVTLFNCFVMGVIGDSLDAIFDALKEGALTMQQGGGIGVDFSTLRPYGSAARSHGAVASGPVSFMALWDSMCATLLSTGNRRGAMMATLRCDHPDIERFIEAKRDPGRLRNFNLSVLVSDDFMRAVESGADWPLVFPAASLGPGEGALVRRAWPGQHGETPCRVVRTVPARALWERILRASYDSAEPGVLFSDRINRENNLAYREHLSATNPCGEIPLPPYGACDLGSLNLAHFVREPFTNQAHIDWQALEEAARVAVRLLDNVIDLSRYPLPAQQEQARCSRRIGLGITALADAFILLGLHYDSDAARAQAARIMQTLRDAAYRASVEIAREKGPFPCFEAGPYLASPFIRRLPEALQADIARHGIRNSHLLAIAPTGTISLLANNVSNGLEPVYALDYARRVRQPDGDYRSHRVTDYAWRLFRRLHPDAGRPDVFVDALSLPPQAHLSMQAALQPFVDNAISKTINIPADYDFAAYRGIYEAAFALGLKGCTTFRPNPITGELLSQPAGEAAHCCSLDREPG